MKKQSVKYIINANGEKIAVIIPIKVYEKLLENLEELKDIRIYDKVKSKKEESIPFDQYLKERTS